MEEKSKPFKFKGISLFVILFLLLTLFSSLFIGKTTYILIDREYGKAISYSENAIKSDVPIDIIVYSVLLAFCLAFTALSVVKITKKNIKHWIWIMIVILLMSGLATYVAYASFDMNYINQLRNL